MTSDLPTVATIASIIVTLASAYIGLKKLQAESKKEKAEHDAIILLEAKEAIASLEREINSKFEALRKEIDNQKEIVDQEIGHVKETYGADMSNVTQKLEELREDVRTQNNQMISLLTKMAEPKE